MLNHGRLVTKYVQITKWNRLIYWKKCKIKIAPPAGLGPATLRLSASANQLHHQRLPCFKLFNYFYYFLYILAVRIVKHKLKKI